MQASQAKPSQAGAAAAAVCAYLRDSSQVADRHDGNGPGLILGDEFHNDNQGDDEVEDGADGSEEPVGAQGGARDMGQHDLDGDEGDGCAGADGVTGVLLGDAGLATHGVVGVVGGKGEEGEEDDVGEVVEEGEAEAGGEVLQHGDEGKAVPG